MVVVPNWRGIRRPIFRGKAEINLGPLSQQFNNRWAVGQWVVGHQSRETGWGHVMGTSFTGRFPTSRYSSFHFCLWGGGGGGGRGGALGSNFSDETHVDECRSRKLLLLQSRSPFPPKNKWKTKYLQTELVTSPQGVTFTQIQIFLKPLHFIYNHFSSSSSSLISFFFWSLPPPFFLFYLCLCLVFVFMSVFMQNSVFDSCRGFEKVGARRRALGNVRECSRVEDASFPRNQLAMAKQLHPSASLRASQRILDNISWVCLLFPLLIVFVFHCLFVGWGFFFCFQIVCHLSRN